jgi:hypothetical protein
MFLVPESYAIEKSSWTLRNSGCRVESLLSDKYVDPMKPRGKGRSSPEWQFCWPYETEGGRAEALLSDNSVDPKKLRGEGQWVTILLTPRNRGWMAQNLSLGDHYVDPMKLRGKHRISPEWQQCWPYETEGEGHGLSLIWVTIMFTLRNRGWMAFS